MTPLASTTRGALAGVAGLMIAVLLAVLAGCGAERASSATRGYSGPSEAEIRTTLRLRLDTTQAAPASLPFDEDWLDEARRAYAAREFRPIWTGSGTAVGRAEALLREVGRADRYALNAADYDLESLRSVLERASADRGNVDVYADLELQLSDLFLRFGNDLATGPFTPQSVGAEWYVGAPDADLAGALGRAASGSVGDVLRRIASEDDGFRRLQEALDRYEEAAASAGFPRIEKGEATGPGEADPRVPTLRQRLAAEGYDVGVAADSVLDVRLAGALASYQETHGIVPDSILGPATVDALNLTADQRVQRIRTNIVRWLWMPQDLGGRYVFVNLPEYQLHAYDGGQEVLTMRVVIGAEFDDRATPAFSDSISYAEFRPYWNVPPGIAERELVEEGPARLEARGFEIVSSYGVGEEGVRPMTQENLEAVARGDLFLRQKPGRDNALGNVKYMFPNEFAIYLHDTPEQDLFARVDRAASFGCIRVEDPYALGAYLFRDAGWDEAEIRRRIETGPENDRADLGRPVPVYILYLTAFVDDAGRVHFRDDLYGYDEPIMAALAEQDSRRQAVDVESLIALLPS
jgi:L,D-transpeptidase YcbB